MKRQGKDIPEEELTRSQVYIVTPVAGEMGYDDNPHMIKETMEELIHHLAV